jgi:hypothetical protein
MTLVSPTSRASESIFETSREGSSSRCYAAERPNLYLPDEQLRSLVKDYPFEVDLPLGDYTPHRATGSWSPLRGTDPPTVVRHDGIFDPLVGSSAIHNLA